MIYFYEGSAVLRILDVKTEATGLCRVHAALRSLRLRLIIYLTSEKPAKQ